MSATAEETIAWLLCAWLLTLVGAFLVVSLRWPMVGDATFMHYVIFLTKHGMVPYRDIVDMNLPGAYLLEATEMRLLGPGSIGWRVYDFCLMLVAVVSLFTILRREGKLVGVMAAALFVLIHGQDGVLMAGERDFAGAALLLAAVACLFVMTRDWSSAAKSTVLGGCFGALGGFACCIKPTFLPMIVGLMIWTEWMRRTRSLGFSRVFVPMLIGLILPVLLCCLFLWRSGAVAGFSEEVRGLIPYHASIDPRSIKYLLETCVSPLAGMLFLWLLAAWILRRSSAHPEHAALIVSAAGGLLSYLLQRKGFWYQRYPLLAFLLPLFVLDFGRVLQVRSWLRAVGVAGVAVGVVLATHCLIRLVRFDREEPPRPLLRDLEALGGSARLSGHVQCMDTVGDCLDSLYAGGIVQSTGFLYDCYLLGGRGNDPQGSVTGELRRHFWREMAQNPPQVVVETDSVCYEPVRSFDKYAAWPEFQNYLAVNYVLVKQSGVRRPVQYWSRTQIPFGYRIYLRRVEARSLPSGGRN